MKRQGIVHRLTGPPTWTRLTPEARERSANLSVPVPVRVRLLRFLARRDMRGVSFGEFLSRALDSAEREVAHNQAVMADAVEWWNARGDVHALTCGEDSRHGSIEPIADQDGVLVLQCPRCGYRQRTVPRAVLDAYHAEVLGIYHDPDDDRPDDAPDADAAGG